MGAGNSYWDRSIGELVEIDDRECAHYWVQTRSLPECILLARGYDPSVAYIPPTDRTLEPLDRQIRATRFQKIYGFCRRDFTEIAAAAFKAHGKGHLDLQYDPPQGEASFDSWGEPLLIPDSYYVKVSDFVAWYVNQDWKIGANHDVLALHKPFQVLLDTPSKAGSRQDEKPQSPGHELADDAPEVGKGESIRGSDLRVVLMKQIECTREQADSRISRACTSGPLHGVARKVGGQWTIPKTSALEWAYGEKSVKGRTSNFDVV